MSDGEKSFVELLEGVHDGDLLRVIVRTLVGLKLRVMDGEMEGVSEPVDDLDELGPECVRVPCSDIELDIDTESEMVALRVTDGDLLVKEIVRSFDTVAVREDDADHEVETGCEMLKLIVAERPNVAEGFDALVDGVGERPVFEMVFWLLKDGVGFDSVADFVRDGVTERADWVICCDTVAVYDMLIARVSDSETVTEGV